MQFWVFLALMAGFAVKVPLVPLHTWLPLAHVEAPTAGSVDLAGVLLKIGAYGFLRLCVPLAPDASLAVGLPLISILAAIGIIYGAFCAFSQDDIKKLVAYSSVSHLGLVMLGMFALNVAGLSRQPPADDQSRAVHGRLCSLLVGMIYERYHTRKVSDYGGMASRLPLLACFMVFIGPGEHRPAGSERLCQRGARVDGRSANGVVRGVLAGAGGRRRIDHHPGSLVSADDAPPGLLWAAQGARTTKAMSRSAI